MGSVGSPVILLDLPQSVTSLTGMSLNWYRVNFNLNKYIHFYNHDGCEVSSSQHQNGLSHIHTAIVLSTALCQW
jgi:hypothetical protein